MSNGDHRLYLYENQVELVVTTDAIYVDNRPMNNKKLVAHKGLNNEIIFNIRNRDRKLQNVFSDSLVAYLVNPYTRKRLLTKRLENIIIVRVCHSCLLCIRFCICIIVYIASSGLILGWLTGNEHKVMIFCNDSFSVFILAVII